MKQKKHHKFSAQKSANLILLACTMLFLISYPYHKTLLGGLVFGFASASLIGGIADWFAIKSFFTKPLGISWPEALFKTEMIPKNREEVISVIVDIVQDKVVTRPALRDKIKQIGISEMLIDYVVEHKLINTSVEEIVKKINISSIQKNQKYFKKLARHSVEQNKSEIYKAVNHLVAWAISKGYIQEILTSIAAELQKLLKLPGVYAKLSVLVAGIKNRRYQNNILRLSVINLYDKFNDIPNELLHMADNILESVKDPEFIEKHDVSNHIERYVKYSALSSLRNFINTADIKEIYDEIAGENLEAGAPANVIQEIINGSINKLNSTLKDNTKTRERLIAELDIRLSDFLYKQIEYIIKNKLAEYSNEMLTDEIYNSVGEDLNMIRINGSLVGGVVGIITYTIMYIVG